MSVRSSQEMVSEITPASVLELVLRRCASRMRYTEVRRVYHLVFIGRRGWVAVVGDGGNADYEYVLQPEGRFAEDTPLPPLEWSDCGYGCCAPPCGMA